MITHQTRREAHAIAPVHRRAAILKAMGDDELTCHEIMAKLGFADPNAVRPRVTELMQLGKVEACGKKTDPATGRTVAVFRRTREC